MRRSPPRAFNRMDHEEARPGPPSTTRELSLLSTTPMMTVIAMVLVVEGLSKFW